MSLLDKEFSIAMEEAEAKEVTPDLQKEEEKAADVTQDRNDDPNSVAEGKEADDPEVEDEDNDDADDKKDKKKSKKDDDDECDCGEEDCPKCNPKAKAKLEAAVDYDLECDNIMECMGCPAIREAAEEINYLCLEAVSMNIAFDKTDSACTEAWRTTESEAEKAAITESFKESLKKYVDRFKAFMSKVGKTVENMAKQFKNYIATMCQKLSGKVLGAAGNRMNLNLNGSDEKISMPATLKKGLPDLAKKVAALAPKGLKDVQKIAAGDFDDVEAARAKVAEFLGDYPDKKAIVASVLGDATEVAIKDFKTTNAVAADLKGAAGNADVEVLRKEVKAELDAAMSHFGQLKDIDTAKMTVMIAAINKLVALYNRKLSALTAITTAWMVARAKVLRRAFAGRKGLEKNVSESATLLESFMDMTMM